MIYFDVTSLRSWKGPPVGVIRTSLEGARWLLRNVRDQTSFCVFDNSSTSLFTVGHQEVLNIIERLDSRSPTAGAAPQSVAMPADRAHRLREKWTRGVGRYLSAFTRPGSSSARSAGADGAPFARRPAGAGDPVAHVAGPVNTRETQVVFTESDVYISLGLDWDVGQLPHIRRLKERTRFKAILMCHDVVAIKYPHLCLERISQVFSTYLTELASVADRVICNSAVTQRDFAEVLGKLSCPVPRTTLNNLGAHTPPAAEERPVELPPELQRRPFILYVSTIERRKNHEILYKAYVRLREAGQSELPTLVFVGMRAWGVEDLLRDIAMDPRIRDDFLILKRVSDPALGWLYRNCLFTVFPSLYEGWGLPLGESLAFGKFCIASNRGALPEAGGDLCEYLDPWDVVAWTNALLKYAEDRPLLKEREARIRERFAMRTWDQFGESLFRDVQSLTATSDRGVTV